MVFKLKQKHPERMNNILNITKKLEEKKRKNTIELYGNKIETLKRFVQCSSCHFRCSMCGHHFKNPEAIRPASSTTDFYLCESCREEFEDFLKTTSGEKKSTAFWHNDEWVSLWSSWLDFRRAIMRFRDSDEFEQMTKTSDEYD